MYQAPFSTRVSKAAEILGVIPEIVSEKLKGEGIDDSPSGLAVLDAPTTTIEDLSSILQANLVNISKLKVKAAASYLKGDGFERPKSEEPAPVISNPPAHNLIDAMKTLRPIQQWSDRELLEKYDQDRDSEVEQELHKRSQGRSFIVLKEKSPTGKESIDIENTLELLKMARKRVTPTFLPLSDGKVAPIYPILSLNMDDRIIELCPICGEVLFKGYCNKCSISLGGLGSINIGDDERAYMKLVSDSANFNCNSYADRQALYADAIQGLDRLKKTWPSIIQKFEELKLTNSLPKLRIIASRPTQVQDPFFSDGNRAFGHKTY